MKTSNGWAIDVTADGFWVSAGNVREGPFPTTRDARAWAQATPPPEKPKRPRSMKPIVND